jgi:hypothetical protein
MATTRVSKFRAAVPSIHLQGAIALPLFTTSILASRIPINFGENRQLRIRYDWFNVTNAQRAIRQDETLRTNSGIPNAQFIQFPNPF